MKIDLKDLKPFFEALVKAIERAEVLFSEKGGGPARKEWALDVLCKAWAWPFPFNLFQRWLFGLLIDLIVYIFNYIHGKLWREKIPPHMVETYKHMGVE